MSSASTSQASPWLYFLAGALLPTIGFFYTLGSSSNRRKASMDEEDEDEDLQDITTGGPSSKWGMMDGPYKMVLVVNMELSMGKGKIAAQVGHAAVACYKISQKQCPSGLAAWERTGCAKIALKCPSPEAMEDIAIKALERDIPCYLVEDAGRTQIAAGSRTVLGIGPAPVRVFDELTSHLKLM